MITRVLRRAIVIVLSGIGALYVVATLTPVTAWWARMLAGTWTNPDGDVLVILGADTRNAGVIGYGSYWRATYGVLAWRTGHFQSVVISGAEEISNSIRDLLICEGVPGGVIRTEPRSTSTRENALFTSGLLNLLPGRKVVLLTSDFHMYRALRAFRKAGVDIAPYPYADALKRYNDWRNRWPLFIDLVIETGKIAGYRLRGWI